MPAPCYFEIHADDCARARKFYGDLFGWRFTPFPSDVEYYRIDTGEPGAIPGGLLGRRWEVAPQPPTAFVVTMLVSSVDETMAKAVAAGAQLAVAKFAVPGMGWTAYLTDTEKNTFGLFQVDATAA
jgi:predicted enzyme related to lactoylglutathione lyase